MVSRIKCDCGAALADLPPVVDCLSFLAQTNLVLSMLSFMHVIRYHVLWLPNT